jgi:hypothetical protein
MKDAVHNKLKVMWQQAVSTQRGACPVCLNRIEKITKARHSKTNVSAEFAPETCGVKLRCFEVQ